MNGANKILLLNPPAKKTVLRDYYCSTYPKVNYYWQPIDLLAMAAMLSKRTDVLLIDAIAGRLSSEKTSAKIENYNPDAIFALVSTLTREADLEFLRRISKNRRVIIGGEVALDKNFDFDKNDFISGLILDFTSRFAADFILTGAPSGRVRAPGYTTLPPPVGETYSVGVMPHELMGEKKFRLPLWRGGFYSLLTDFGCPFSCSFCNSGVNSLGFKLRELGELEEEMNYLKKLGATKIYLRDMTFGAHKEHARNVLKLLSNYNFKIRGYLRANLVTEEFVGLLKNAGFNFAQIGIENPIDEKRRKLGKKLDNDKISNAFRLLKKSGIKAGAHFVVGVKGDTSGAAKECADMAGRLGAVYCSINIYKPRMGIEPLQENGGVSRKMLSINAKLMMGKYNLRKYFEYVLEKR